MAYVGNQPTQGNFSKLDNISSGFNGVATVFPLTVSGTAVQAGTAQNMIISISGVLQEPGVAYLVSYTNIVFTEAPLVTDEFFGIVLGNVGDINTVSDDAITSVKLAANSVIGSKILDGAVTATKLGAGSVILTTKVSGILPIENGGTGSNSIKTINGNSISGSGDILIQSTPGQLLMNFGII